MFAHKLFPEPQTETGYPCMVCENAFRDEITYERHIKLLQRVCVCPVCGQRLSWDLQFDHVAHSSHKLYKAGHPDFECPMCNICFDSEADLRQHTDERDDKFGCLFCTSTFSFCIERMEHVVESAHVTDVDSQLLPADIHSTSIFVGGWSARTVMASNIDAFMPSHTEDARNVPNTPQIPLSESSGPDIRSTGTSSIAAGHTQTEGVRRKRKRGALIAALTSHINNEEEKEENDEKEEEDEKKDNGDIASATAALSALSLSKSSRQTKRTDFIVWQHTIKVCKQAILHCKKALLDLPVFLADDDSRVMKLENIEKRLQRTVEHLVPVEGGDAKNEETRVICPGSESFTASAFLELAREGSRQPEPLAKRLATWFHEPPLTSTVVILPSESPAEQKMNTPVEDWLGVAEKALLSFEQCGHE